MLVDERATELFSTLLQIIGRFRKDTSEFLDAFFTELNYITLYLGSIIQRQLLLSCTELEFSQLQLVGFGQLSLALSLFSRRLCWLFFFLLDGCWLGCGFGIYGFWRIGCLRWLSTGSSGSRLAYGSLLWFDFGGFTLFRFGRRCIFFELLSRRRRFAFDSRCLHICGCRLFLRIGSFSRVFLLGCHFKLKLTTATICFSYKAN